MEAVFLKIVNMSLTASWLVLAVLILRFVLNRGPKYIRVMLWGFVGARLIFPFSIESIFSLIPSTEPLPEEFLYAATPQVNTGIPALNQAINPIVAGSLTPAPLTSANPTQIWSFIFSQIWILGIAVMVLYAIVSYLLIRRKVAASIRVGDNLRICDHIDSPFILGVFRPVIYLPSELDRKTADLVLSHEYAHLKRKDHWWKPIGFALLCVYWFNPVMWLAYILLCRDIELACDEKVIAELGSDEKKAYSSALLECSMNRRMIAACPLAFGEVGVKDRIKSVLNYRKPAFWLIVIAVILCVVVAVCFLTDPINKVDPLTLKDWGITVTAQDPTPLGVTLVINVPDNMDGKISIPSNQILLQMEDGKWVDVPPIVDEDVSWDFMHLLTPEDNVTHQRVEWVRYYGFLEPGEYRIEKTLRLYQDGLSYQKEFYVEFTVPSMDDLPADTYSYDVWYFQCKKLIEQIQSLDSYHIQAQWEFEGDRVLNDSSFIDYWKSEDTFLKICYVPADNSTTAYFQSGDAFYSSVTYDGSINWEESEPLDLSVMAPWLYAFEWNEQTVSIFSRGENQEGYSIGIHIEEPYVGSIYQAEYYEVEFYFDNQDVFQYAVLTETTETDSKTGTLRIMSTDSGKIAETVAGYTGFGIEEPYIGTLIASLSEKPSVYLSLNPRESNRYHNDEYRLRGMAWNARNYVQYSNSLRDFTFREIPVAEADLSGAEILMQFMDDENIAEIKFYEGSSDVELWHNNRVTCYRATYKYGDYPIGNIVRSWYDESELAALREGTNLVQDSGLDDLTAAEEFCADYYGIHTAVSPGSMFRYSFVTCQVELDEDATQLARERGELDKNCHAFWVRVIFVLENDRGLADAMAGNTWEYTGDDPSIPEGALVYGRCGYVRLTKDGWVGQIVGTGW